MSRDLLIAIGTEIPDSVSVPLTIGALRAKTTTAAEDAWVEEAILAHRQGRRPVLVGDVSRPDSLLASLLRAKSERPQIRFALLLHFSQALQTPMSDALRSQFDEVFVAVDRMISVADAHRIRLSVRPRWLLIPRVGLNWNEILIDRLMPDRRGIATILCPPTSVPGQTDGPFLSADELLIQLQEFQDAHPLIEIRPPPHEWFVPSQTAPWEMPSRDRLVATVLKKTEEQLVPNVSFIIPFHWRNQPSAVENLATSLRSCLRVVDYTYAQSDSVTVEYIVSVDRDHEVAHLDVEALLKNVDPRIFRSLTIVQCLRENNVDDWRAGFIRNVGADFSRVGSGGLFVFVDSDVEIVDPAIVANEIIEDRNSLVFSRVRSEILPHGKKVLSRENQPFQVASSRLMIVRRSLFENLGGFANAFRTYGCEDNFLVWQTTEIKRKGLPVSLAAFPFSTTRDLRTSSIHEDLLLKMDRLKVAADLFFRMTFDPKVHRHFFVSLGPSIGMRYFLKRLACSSKFRWILGPFVFALTLVETKDRPAYLRGFWDIVKWKAKRPLLLLSSEAWRIGQAKHVAKKHGWKFPLVFLKVYFFLRHVLAMALVVLQRISIKLRATKFGWNILGWRIFVGLQTAWGESRRLTYVYLIFPARHFASQVPWWSKVAGVRILGTLKQIWGMLWGGFRKIFGELRRLSLVYVFFPGLHFAKQIPWWTKVAGIRLGVLVGRLWGFIKLVWGGFKFSLGWGQKLLVDYVWVPGLRIGRSPYHLTRLYGWKVLAMIAAPFRYVRDNFWKLRLVIRKIRGELWRIRVVLLKIRGELSRIRVVLLGELLKIRGELWRIPVLWNRLLGQLWFIPVGFQRLGQKLQQSFRILKEKLRGPS